ncbi:hypothetical protein BURK1_00488 [Burkholderiales bacterium]|nr:hypothetical protein BURK1_00488 [Burkholderiales bacterium]
MTDPAPDAFSSDRAGNFHALLRELASGDGVQAGRVIVVRLPAGSINARFVALPRPRGLAADASRILVGPRSRVHAYRNVPAIAARLDPSDAHDAVCVLRNLHVAGHVDIHEMAFAGSEGRQVNTRFSCLRTLDNDHSFVPRRRPRFVSVCAPEYRCHLNAPVMGGARPRCLTALGESNVREG